MLRKAYKYRIYPSKVQATMLEGTLSVCCDVYNAMLHMRKHDYEVQGVSPSRNDQIKMLPLWKTKHEELSTVHSQVLQNVVRRVDLAFEAYFDRLADYRLREAQGRLRVVNGEPEKCPGSPRPKGKGVYDSITYPQAGAFQVGEDSISFSKLGSVKAVIHREISGMQKTATILRQAGKWFVTISCVVEAAEPLPPSDRHVGIDVGLENFATFSDDTDPIPNPRFFRTDQAALAKAQRRFDRVKNKHRTPSRRKAKKVVARIHERIRNRRHDFHHQEARKIVNAYGVISVEHLNVSNMSKSPAPKFDFENSIYLPNGHAAKAGLNKSILDAGWGQFRVILRSKAESAWREFCENDPAFSSQDCSECGYRPSLGERKPLSQRWHHCPKCGFEAHRDKNSAIILDNIGVGLHAVRIKSIEAPAFRQGE